MASIFTIPLTTARYKKVTALLAQLSEYRRIATAAGLEELRVGVENLVELFETDNKDALLARGVTKPVKFDQYGRSYTVGRRKTSVARVWIIRTNTYATMDPAERAPIRDLAGSTPASQPKTHDPDYIAEVLEILAEGPPAQASSTTSPHVTPTSPGQLPQSESLQDPLPPPKPQIPITPSEILINNTPLASYFPLPADRERVVRPLRIAGLLGAYNVFSIVRGGGMSGQSGAVALGIAKGLVAQEHRWGVDKEGEVVETVLRKAKLLRRDPRMVERKKTGFAKARKRVRVSFPSCEMLEIDPPSTVCLGQAIIATIASAIMWSILWSAPTAPICGTCVSSD
jgi:small subunit ribosomal protein S9